VLRYEPQILSLVNSNPAFRVFFEQEGCMRFCEKIQGYNMQLTKEFALNFNGFQTTIAEVIFPVSEETIVVATDIPIQGEKWFKEKVGKLEPPSQPHLQFCLKIVMYNTCVANLLRKYCKYIEIERTTKDDWYVVNTGLQQVVTIYKCTGFKKITALRKFTMQLL
jgi:hypothetical protein